AFQTENGVCTEIRRRNGAIGNSEGHGHFGRICENTFVSGGACRSKAIGETPMNTHLTEEQISNWIAGDEAGVELDRHVRECGQCNATWTSFQTSMSVFRDSANGFVNQQHSSMVLAAARVRRESRQARMRSFRWLMVAGAAVIVAAVPVYRRSIQSPQEPMAV